MLRRLLPAILLLALAAPLGACQTLNKINPFSDDVPAPDERPDPTTVAPELLYNNGVDALNLQRYQTASQQFDLVEQTYPYSSWAVNAQLMQGYVEYLQNHFTPAIGALDRFIQLHPAHKDIAYAYYLRALCYYEQIADVRREQKGTREAMGALQEVINRFPDSEYARDAKLKIDLAFDHLAGKEMEVGRFYQKQHLYTAAIGRFQTVANDYQTTNHAPEALSRLVEIYLALGLPEDAKRTAAVLGYNYPGSQWYQDTYNQLASAGLLGPDVKPVGPTGESPGFFRRAWNTVF